MGETVMVQCVRGTTAKNDAFAGKSGLISIDTDKKELRIHDNSTVGGVATFINKVTISTTYCTKAEFTTAIGDIDAALDTINGEVI